MTKDQANQPMYPMQGMYTPNGDYIGGNMGITYYHWLFGMVLQGLVANATIIRDPAEYAYWAHRQVMESLPYINPPA